MSEPNRRSVREIAIAHAVDLHRVDPNRDVIGTAREIEAYFHEVRVRQEERGRSYGQRDLAGPPPAPVRFFKDARSFVRCEVDGGHHLAVYSTTSPVRWAVMCLDCDDDVWAYLADVSAKAGPC